MSNQFDSRIEAIQASGYKTAMVVTGGGSGAVHALLSHPGASRFILEAQIPYSSRAMFDYLGETLESSCSASAAETMASRAFERALVFTLSNERSSPILGISCTAALQTTRERKGKDRAYLCIKSRNEQLLQEVEFQQTNRTAQEEKLTEELLKTIARFLGVEEE